VIVNATPLGLEGSVKELPFRVDTLHSDQVVVDLVYGQGRTVLVEGALARGAVAIDGKEMLVMQAALAYRLWTGLEPPIDAMRDSAESGEK
jgi:shikimate dehydrogenase